MYVCVYVCRCVGVCVCRCVSVQSCVRVYIAKQVVIYLIQIFSVGQEIPMQISTTVKHRSGLIALIISFLSDRLETERPLDQRETARLTSSLIGFQIK